MQSNSNDIKQLAELMKTKQVISEGNTKRLNERFNAILDRFDKVSSALKQSNAAINNLATNVRAQDQWIDNKGLKGLKS